MPGARQVIAAPPNPAAQAEAHRARIAELRSKATRTPQDIAELLNLLADMVLGKADD